MFCELVLCTDVLVLVTTLLYSMEVVHCDRFSVSGCAVVRLYSTVCAVCGSGCEGFCLSFCRFMLMFH